MTLGEARLQGPLSRPKESKSKKSTHQTFNQKLTSKGTLADASPAPHSGPHEKEFTCSARFRISIREN